MNRKKKNTLMNSLMVAAIVLIAAAGVLFTGKLKGWFDKAPVSEPASVIPESAATEEEAPKTVVLSTCAKTGSANIYRGGFAYSLEEGTMLRTGDEIETLNRSKIGLEMNNGAGTILLDENTRISVVSLENGEAGLELVNGSLFADILSPLSLNVHDCSVRFEDAVFSAAAFYGSAGMSVYAGQGCTGDVSLGKGDSVSLLSEESGGNAFSRAVLTSLNEFELAGLASVPAERNACFTAGDIAALNAEREAEKQSALEAKLLEGENEARLAAQRESGKDGLKYEPGKGSSGDDSGDTTPHCTIEIRCDTILDNMADLTEGKDAYVPANGVILATSRLSFNEGETAFDVLKRACSLAGIQLEYSWTPMYNSYYVEGINNLYEFDCGVQSGWMYKVNGWFPNYGSSSYTMKDGDVMVWCFTCKGLGADVGGSVY